MTQKGYRQCGLAWDGGPCRFSALHELAVDEPLEVATAAGRSLVVRPQTRPICGAHIQRLMAAVPALVDHVRPIRTKAGARAGA